MKPPVLLALLIGSGLAAGSSVVPAAPTSPDLPPLTGASPPYFKADLAISLDAEDRVALSVSIGVPYPELQWRLSSSGYGAGVEIMVSLEPDDRAERVFGDTWSDRIVVPTFQETTAPRALQASRTFRLPPGGYRARVSVSDLASGLTSSASERLRVPDLSRVPLGLSDLALGLSDSAGAFVPMPARMYGLEARALAARVVLFDHRPGPWPRVLTLAYRVLDEMREEELAGTMPVTMAHAVEPVVLRIPAGGLFLGEYLLEVSLLGGESPWRVERSFEVTESGPPRGQDFTRIMEVLSYIAEPGEVARLRSLEPARQAAGWEEFWRRRDPDPDTGVNEARVEFFRRVRYTEHHFQGYGPGWRTDMGRIYIKYGPPDQVEAVAYQGDRPGIEVWTYNRPLRRFLFEDRDGFGRFVLISPAFE